MTVGDDDRRLTPQRNGREGKPPVEEEETATCAARSKETRKSRATDPTRDAPLGHPLLHILDFICNNDLAHVTGVVSLRPGGATDYSPGR
jgi:hypothetical protein